MAKPATVTCRASRSTSGMPARSSRLNKPLDPRVFKLRRAICGPAFLWLPDQALRRPSTNGAEAFGHRWTGPPPPAFSTELAPEKISTSCGPKKPAFSIAARIRFMVDDADLPSCPRSSSRSLVGTSQSQMWCARIWPIGAGPRDLIIKLRVPPDMVDIDGNADAFTKQVTDIERLFQRVYAGAVGGIASGVAARSPAECQHCAHAAGSPQCRPTPFRERERYPC